MHFDLDPGGALGDAEARKFLIKARPAFARGTVSTPPVMIMTQNGEIIAEASNYASEEEVLDTLIGLMEDPRNERFFRPSAEENDLAERLSDGDTDTAIARLELLIDLAQYDNAIELAASAISPEHPQANDRLRLLAAHAARLAGDPKHAENVLEAIEDPDRHLEAIALERAHAAFAERDLVAMKAALDSADAAVESLEGAAPTAERATERLYLRGLLHYHLGEKDQAKVAWTQAVEDHPQDRFVYRADWGLSDLTQKKSRMMFSSAGGGSKSLLGRIGYMGRKNPDLSP